MKKVQKFLKAIDLFGRRTQLKISQRSKFKTEIGGCFTFLMIGVCTALFLNLGSDMMYHQNPTSIFAEVLKPFPDPLLITKDKYFFYFGIQSPSFEHFIDNTIYTVSVINYRVSLSGNNTFVPVPVEPCTLDHFPSDPDLYNYFLNAARSPINNLYCIAKGLDNKFQIYGAFDADVYQYIDINIQICQNSTDPTAPVCKPLDIIKQSLSGYFAYFFTDYLINPDDYENPGKAVGKDYFFPISVGVTRNTNRYIANSKVYSDDGFLFSSTDNLKQYPTYKEDKETFLIDSTNSGALVQFRLRKHHDEMIYSRRYKKLQNVMAEMGGFMQITYLILFLITYPMVSKRYFEKLTNSIYNFEIVDDEKYKLSKKERKNNSMNSSISKYLSSTDNNVKVNPIKPKVLDPIRVSTLESQDHKMNFMIKSVSKKKIEKHDETMVKRLINIQHKPPVKTTFWEYFKGSVLSVVDVGGEQLRKFFLLQKGKSYISEKLEIAFILKKFYEIDKLKMLILDQNQYHLFEYLPKPVILKNKKIDLSYSDRGDRSTERENNFDDGEKMGKFISYENDIVRKTKKMYSAYQNIIKKTELSEMDKKLINLLDGNVKKTFTVYRLFLKIINFL